MSGWRARRGNSAKEPNTWLTPSKGTEPHGRCQSTLAVDYAISLLRKGRVVGFTGTGASGLARRAVGSATQGDRLRPGAPRS